MMKFAFDAELKGCDGKALPVHCEVQQPLVGGQKAHISVAIPAQHLTDDPPQNPCTVSGREGSICMQGVHWRRFPTSSNGTLGLEDIELLHVERLTVKFPSGSGRRELCIHLAPISYLRSESGAVDFGDKSHREELFCLDLPDLGVTSFAAEWATVYYRDAEIPGANVVAGFCAVVSLPVEGAIDVEQLVAHFKSSLDVLSVLFRQAVSVHGWTYTDGEVISTWVAPLEPNITLSAREERGDFVARPQVFAECATELAQAYARADKKVRSLVRHLSLAVAPHNTLRASDHFLFMFSALERVASFSSGRDRTPRSPAVTDAELVALLERAQRDVVAEGGENAADISARLEGLIGVVQRPSVRDKFEAIFRVHPPMTHYCGDLWPILGSGKERGLKEIRDALAHGRSSFVSHEVVAVAKWHLAILLERLVFVLLGLPMPQGISPNSLLLKLGGRGWYDRDWWAPIRATPDKPI